MYGFGLVLVSAHARRRWAGPSYWGLLKAPKIPMIETATCMATISYPGNKYVTPGNHPGPRRLRVRGYRANVIANIRSKSKSFWNLVVPFFSEKSIII